MLLLRPKVRPSQRKRVCACTRAKILHTFGVQNDRIPLRSFHFGRMWASAPTRFSGGFGTSRTPSPTQYTKIYLFAKSQFTTQKGIGFIQCLFSIFLYSSQLPETIFEPRAYAFAFSIGNTVLWRFSTNSASKYVQSNFE